MHWPKTFFFLKVIYFYSYSTKLSYCWVELQSYYLKFHLGDMSWLHEETEVPRCCLFPKGTAHLFFHGKSLCSFILVWWGSFTTTFFPFRLDTIHLSISFESIFFFGMQYYSSPWVIRPFSVCLVPWSARECHPVNRFLGYTLPPCFPLNPYILVPHLTSETYFICLVFWVPFKYHIPSKLLFGRGGCFF